MPITTKTNWQAGNTVAAIVFLRDQVQAKFTAVDQRITAIGGGTRLPSPPQQVEAIDSSTTISVAWEIVRCTGSITVTLPSPATSPVGKVYTILNAGSGTVTLAGALNGPSSVSANSARRVMSSGSGWDVF